MQIAKYPARSNAVPKNLASRAFISKISYVEAIWNATSNNLMQQTSIFKVGDAAPNNFVNEVYVRTFCSPARGKLDGLDTCLKGFPIARLKDLTTQTSILKVAEAGLNNLRTRTTISKVGDAGLNNLTKRNFYPEAFCEEARCWSAAFSSRSFTNAKSTRFAGVAMPSSLPRRAT
jgi:hypothetical protein